MKTFYKQTYWFWVISKIIFILLLLISCLSILSAGKLRTPEFAVNFAGLLEAILLGITLVHDFSKSNFKYLKIITGSVLIVFGIGLFLVLITASKGTLNDASFLGYPFLIWMILIGIFDLLRIEKTTTNQDIAR